MNRKCPVCGIMFDVLYPDLWRFKRNHIFYCTYSCLKLSDEGVKEMAKITKEQKQKAVDIALDGGNPVEFLKGCGSMAPDQMWTYIKKTLKAKEPEVYAKLLLKAVDKAPTVKFEDVKKDIMEIPQIKLDGPIRIETPEANKVEIVEKPEKKPVPEKYGIHNPLMYDQFTVREVEGLFGRYRYSDIGSAVYIDYENTEGVDVLSLTVDQWRRFREEQEKAAAILGVEL